MARARWMQRDLKRVGGRKASELCKVVTMFMESEPGKYFY
jgi:hypothetical protein